MGAKRRIIVTFGFLLRGFRVEGLGFRVVERRARLIFYPCMFVTCVCIRVRGSYLVSCLESTSSKPAAQQAMERPQKVFGFWS